MKFGMFPILGGISLRKVPSSDFQGAGAFVVSPGMKTFIAFAGGCFVGWLLRDFAQAFKEADEAMGVTARDIDSRAIRDDAITGRKIGMFR